MKIQFCSDLHLEFKQNRNWIKQNPIIPEAKILIIAGDTFYLGRNFGELDFLKQVSKDFELVYLIPGNHEYYDGFNIATSLQQTNDEILPNVFMVNNFTTKIKDVSFIFSTMWSIIEKKIAEIVTGMADFKYMKFDNKKITFKDYNKIHHYCFNFLKNEIKKEGKKVVVTHHLPSNLCNAKEFVGSTLNEGFCIDKTDFILNNKIDFWIYGHSHRNIKDFEIGNTKMLCNQLGYVGWKEHKSFNNKKVFEV